MEQTEEASALRRLMGYSVVFILAVAVAYLMGRYLFAKTAQSAITLAFLVGVGTVISAAITRRQHRRGWFQD